MTKILSCATAPGGIGLRAKIINRESFSDFILAYVESSLAALEVARVSVY